MTVNLIVNMFVFFFFRLLFHIGQSNNADLSLGQEVSTQPLSLSSAREKGDPLFKSPVGPDLSGFGGAAPNSAPIRPEGTPSTAFETGKEEAGDDFVAISPPPPLPSFTAGAAPILGMLQSSSSSSSAQAPPGAEPFRSSEPVVSGAVGEQGWVRTKAFAHLVDANSPFPGTGGGDVACLSDLHVLRAKNGKLVLCPAEGQFVTIGARKFHLLMALKVGRHFKVWVRDTTTEEVFVAMARDLDTATTAPESSKVNLNFTRLQVLAL